LAEPALLAKLNYTLFMYCCTGLNMPSNVAVHTISFRGKAGAIFVTLCCAVVSFIVGYVTQSWSLDGNRREGLWEKCNCSTIHSHDGKYKLALSTEKSFCLRKHIIYFLLDNDRYR